MFSSSSCRLVLGLLTLSQLSQCHTWIEQLDVIDSTNGSMVGTAGFARGNVLRSNPGFGDPTMVNLLSDIGPTDLMCKSSQTSQTQTDGSPRLQAPAGAVIALRYQENGHVTLPENQPGKPSNRGTNYVYGTASSTPDDAFLAIHRQWTPNGKGGDGRGALISTQNFDDGQCYQVNGGAISMARQKQFSHTATQLMGANLWCQQDVTIPADLKAGSTYTLYWVWDWPTMPGTPGLEAGKQEIYTTCMDIDIVDSSSIGSVSKGVVNYQQGQDLNFAGISSQLADIANPTAVVGESIPFPNAPTPTAQSASASGTLTESSSLGESIAFTAVATGPASGVAASESTSPSSTDVSAFLSIHTISTSGAPGLQTFSVIPVGASTVNTGAQPTGQPQPADGDDRGGRVGNFSGMPFPPLNCTRTHSRPQGTASPPTRPISVVTIVAAPTSASEVVVTVTVTETQNAKRTNMPAGFDSVGSATNVNAVIATGNGVQVVTQWVATQTITEWVTALETAFDKRDEPTAAPSVSGQHSVYRLRARAPFA